MRLKTRAQRPGPEIFDPSFFDPEKKFSTFVILNLESGPELKFSSEIGPEKLEI